MLISQARTAQNTSLWGTLAPRLAVFMAVAWLASCTAMAQEDTPAESAAEPPAAAENPLHQALKIL